MDMEKTILIPFLLFRWADYDQNLSLSFILWQRQEFAVYNLKEITILKSPTFMIIPTT
jgi:hypothetical protein